MHKTTYSIVTNLHYWFAFELKRPFLNRGWNVFWTWCVLELISRSEQASKLELPLTQCRSNGLYHPKPNLKFMPLYIFYQIPIFFPHKQLFSFRYFDLLTFLQSKRRLKKPKMQSMASFFLTKHNFFLNQTWFLINNYIIAGNKIQVCPSL